MPLRNLRVRCDSVRPLGDESSQGARAPQAPCPPGRARDRVRRRRRPDPHRPPAPTWSCRCRFRRCQACTPGSCAPAARLAPAVSRMTRWLLEDLGQHQRHVRWRRAAEARRQAAADRGDADRAGSGEVDLRRRGARDDATPTYVRRQISDLLSPGADGGARPRSWRWSPASEGAETFRFAERESPLRHRPRQVVRLPHQGRAEVSREHAVFTWRDQGVELADLGSANGVLVNGEQALGPSGSTTGTWCRWAGEDALFRSQRPAPRGADGASAIAATQRPEASCARPPRPPTTRATSAAAAATICRARFGRALHPAVAGALSAERAQRRPSATRVAELGGAADSLRSIVAVTRPPFYLIVVAAAVILARGGAGRRL